VQDTEKMFSTNVHGLITMTRQILPGMVARNRGHIFNIGSTAGHEAYAGGSIYCATKFAVRGFTDALRYDVCGTQVRAVLLLRPPTQSPHEMCCVEPVHAVTCSWCKSMESMYRSPLLDPDMDHRTIQLRCATISGWSMLRVAHRT
jgi:short-subunit dehydrogenase